MLKIRLRRTGKRNQPHYRIVVAEHTAPVTGKIVASLGHFNPRTKEIVVDSDEALRWMNQGAQPSNTVARLLLKHGIAHKALVVHTFAQRPPKKAVPEATTKPVEETPAAEATPTEEETESATEEAASDDEAQPAIEPEPTKEGQTAENSQKESDQ